MKEYMESQRVESIPGVRDLIEDIKKKGPEGVRRFCNRQRYDIDNTEKNWTAGIF